MREFEVLYRIKGIRNLNQLLTTKVLPLNTLEFPRNTLFHYYTFDEEAKGIDTNLFFFEDIKRRIYAVNEIQYNVPKGTLGEYRYLTAGLNNSIRHFFFEHRKFRLVRTLVGVNLDPSLLSLVNYSYIPTVYDYMPKPLNFYYKWYNLMSTIMNTINKFAGSKLNHFLFINLPAILPTLSEFRRFKNINHVALEIFNNNDSLLLRDIFNFCREENLEENVLAQLDRKIYPNVNLVFMFNSKYYILNMEYLYAFNKSHESTIKVGYKSNKELLGKIFLNSLIILQSRGITDVNPTEEVVDDNQEKEEEIIDEDETDNADTSESNNIPVATNIDDEDIHYLSNKQLNEDVDTSALEIKKALQEMNSNLEGLEVQSKLREVSNSENDFNKVIDEIRNHKDPTEALKSKLDEYSLFNVLNGSEIKTLQKKLESFTNLSNPYDPNSKLIDSTNITKKELKLNNQEVVFKDNTSILDKTMLRSTMVDFDKQYLQNTLHKDILNMVKGMQHGNVIIENYKVEPVYTIDGDYEIHRLKVHPIEGVASTLTFKIPIVDENGTYKVNGSKYILRKQRGDLPIKKIKPDKVAMSSYYNKVFVERSQMKKDDITTSVFKYIFNNGIQVSDNFIHDVKMGEVFDSYYKCPRIYSAIAENFSSFIIEDLHFSFDHKKLEKEFDKELRELDDKALYPCGTTSTGKLILMDEEGLLYSFSNSKREFIGNFYTKLKLDPNTLPIEYTAIKIFTKDIPLGVVLGHYIGLDNLIKVLNTKDYEFIDNTDKKTVNDKRDNNEYLKLKFKDKTLVVSKLEKAVCTILGGLNSLDIKTYNYAEFNKKNVYFNLISQLGLNTIYIKEMDLLKDMFIDPITLELLQDYKLPTTFIDLLLKANEMLLDDEHPDDLDMKYMRIKGYERIAGTIYNSLTKAIRVYRLKNNNGKLRIDLNPNEIFNTITGDSANLLVTDINPIQLLKQREAITYLGEGGRSRDVMNKESRRYHPNDMGIISEATVDSSDVGINTYMSANPLFNSTRGTTDKYVFDKDKATSLLSTSAMLAPASVHDDPKRVNMVNVQQSHTVSTDGYRQPLIRTGYEYIIPQRLKNEFAYSADEDGKVISLTLTGIIVEYKDGKRKGFNLGRTFGKAEGTFYPHLITTLLKEGQEFKKNDIIIFNDGFFEEDILNPGNIILKNNKFIKVALYESPQTWEDSSAISKELSIVMRTKATKVKTLVINFDQDVRNVVKTGQHVKPLDTLLIVENAITTKSNLLSEDSLSLLKQISSNNPKSKIDGIVEKIEVFYNGDKEDMSKGLLELANESDKILRKECKDSNRPIVTGRVNSEHRVEGVPLELDQAEIRFYITTDNDLGVGDKAVFANQLKSVVGEVMDYPIHSEQGEKIDAVFGQKSIDARIVLSPEIMGTTATLLKLVAKKAVEIYK